MGVEERLEGGKDYAPLIMIVHKTTQYAQNMVFASVQPIEGEVFTVGDKGEEGEEDQNSPHAPPIAIVLPVLLSVLSMASVSVFYTSMVDQNAGSKEAVVVDLEDRTLLAEEGDMEVETMQVEEG